MKVYPVSSKETELNAKDIILVASFEEKHELDKFKEPAKKVGMSPERFAFTANLKLYSDPKLLRIRAGNSLFTIATFAPRVGYVRGYNGDTPENYRSNILEFFQSARKMGYDKLLFYLSEPMWKELKDINRSGEIELRFNSQRRLAYASTGPERN